MRFTWCALPRRHSFTVQSGLHQFRMLVVNVSRLLRIRHHVVELTGWLAACGSSSSAQRSRPIPVSGSTSTLPSEWRTHQVPNGTQPNRARSCSLRLNRCAAILTLSSAAPFGSFRLHNSATVEMTSVRHTSRWFTCPRLLRAGQDTISGTRWPPSQRSAFVPAASRCSDVRSPSRTCFEASIGHTLRHPFPVTPTSATVLRCRW